MGGNLARATLRRFAPAAAARLPDTPAATELLPRALGVKVPSIAEATTSATDAITSRLSPALQADKQELSQAEGFIGAAGTVLRRPRLLSQFVAEQVPNLVTLGAGTRAAAAEAAESAIGRALGQGLSREAAQTAGREAAKRGSTTFLTGANAAMESGAAGIQAQQDALSLPDEVWQQNAAYQALVQRGVASDDAKRQLAGDTAFSARLIGAAAGALGGRVSAPFEADVFNRAIPGGARALLTRPGLTRVAGGIAREATEEGVTQGGSQFGSNVGVAGIDPNRGLLDGVPEAAGIGATLGAVMGGGMGVVGTAIGEGEPAAQQQPTLRPPPLPPPELPPEVRALPAPETFTVGPDGQAERGATRPEVFAEPEMRFPQGRGMSAPYLRRPGEPAPQRYPNAPTG
jgi:hypothetical protein